MAIVTIQTTISPFSGQQLDAPISLSYDTDKINWSSLEPQDNDTTCRFLYMIKESVEALPFDSSAFGMAYANCTTTQLFDIANPALGPAVAWSIPASPQIMYFNAVGGASNSTITLESVPDALWTLENLNKGTATNSVEVFTPSVTAESTKTYRVNRAVSTPLSGVITMDAVATADGGSTTTPLTFVIRPSNGFTPSGVISDPIAPAGSWFWTVTTNIPCDIEFLDQNDGGTGVNWQIIPLSTISFYIGASGYSTPGTATFRYKLTSTDNPLCFINSAESPATPFTLDCTG
jgi:hypothetical protein